MLLSLDEIEETYLHPKECYAGKEINRGFEILQFVWLRGRKTILNNDTLEENYFCQETRPFKMPSPKTCVPGRIIKNV